MSQTNMLYTILNTENDLEIPDLDLESLLKIASKWTSQDLIKWMIWHEGATDWMPIYEFSEIRSVIDKIPKRSSPPPRPKMNQTPVVPEAPLEIEPIAAEPVVAKSAEADPAEIPAPKPTASKYGLIPLRSSAAKSENVAPVMVVPMQAAPETVIPEVKVEEPVIVLEDEALKIIEVNSAPENSKEQDVVVKTESEKSNEDRRKYPRHNVKLRVILSNGVVTFRTFSQNVSLGGLSLEHPLPTCFHGQDCDLYIGHPKTKENIKLRGIIIGNSADAHRMSFTDSSENTLKRLNQWIEEHCPEVKISRVS